MFETTYGESLHDSSEITEGHHDCPEEHGPPSGSCISRLNLAQQHVGKCVIGHKIKVRGKIEANWHIVESVRGKVIESLQYRVEVMRVPVVPYEAEARYPEVCFETVSHVYG